MLIPVAALSQARVCGRSLAEISGSNPAGDMDVSLISVVCCLVDVCVCRADHSSRGFLPSVMCLSGIVMLR